MTYIKADLVLCQETGQLTIEVGDKELILTPESLKGRRTSVLAVLNGRPVAEVFNDPRGVMRLIARTIISARQVPNAPD